MIMKSNSSIVMKILRFFQLLFKIIFWMIPLIFKGFALTFKHLGGFIGYNRKMFRRLFRFSITFKLTVLYAFLFSFLMVILSTGILLGFRFYLMEQVGNDLKKTSTYSMDRILTDTGFDEGQLKTAAERDNAVISIFNEDKKILYSTSKSQEDIVFNNRLNQPHRIAGSNQMKLTRQTFLDQRPCYIQVEKSLNTQLMALQILVSILFVANGIGILFIILIGSKVSRKVLHPIEKMTRTVKAISIQDLSTRLDVSGSHDELRELAETFNDMFDRIQNAYEIQNNFVSDASHELRTPISVIQGYINMLDRWGKHDGKVLDESISAIKDESENMKGLIEKLLFLARGDKNRHSVEKQHFSFNELIDEVIKETGLIDSQHHIINEYNEAIEVFGDRRLLKQAIRIFMDNSMKFTPHGGTIKINTHIRKKQLLVSIEDSGIGISKEDLPHIFNRFYRSDKSRTKQTGGHGLGLSIAKWIIDNHDGKIEVQSTIPGGTKFTIFLPGNT